MGRVLFFIALMVPAALQAESFEEFSKGYRGEFETYKEEQNREFSEFVKKQWEEFRVFAGYKAYEEPKIDKPPVAPKSETPKAESKIPAVLPQETAIPKPSRQPQPKVLSTTPLPKVTFDFYGTAVSIPYEKSLVSHLGKPSKESITRELEKLVSKKYDTTHKSLESYRSVMHLNDWGFYLLVHRFALELTGQNSDANLITWFFMLKSGLDTKVAFNDRDLFLFGLTGDKLYQTAFITEAGKNYYILDPEGRRSRIGAVFTFKGNYPKSEKPLDCRVGDMLFSDKAASRKLDFSYRGRSYAIRVEYNPHTIDFYTDSPQTEFGLYFDAGVEYRAKQSLLSELAPLVKGRSELDAVNFLLRFVQSAFAYETDEQQFKREKPFFPEETLYYPYSDCEDRSILFAYLVRKLLGLEVVALHYPGHLATAVNLSGKVEGDSLNHKGKRYIVADPTYIGADAGMTMPQFKSSKFTVVEMKL